MNSFIRKGSYNSTTAFTSKFYTSLNTALIFGAGKTGRGFAAHLAYLGAYEIVLVDKDQQLVDALNQAKQYAIEVLDNEEKSCFIPLKASYHITDVSWHREWTKAPVAFTAVFGNQLELLAEALAAAIKGRYRENKEGIGTIITCENLTGAAALLRKSVLKRLAEDEANWLRKHIGFSEAIIFRTCIGPAAGQSPLTIRTHDFFELPCDAEEVKEPLHIPGLKPMCNFANQLKRKIFTYNCINAVISYLGAAKGYQQLYEAGNDETILHIARKAAAETAAALVAEFNFDQQEQKEWTAAAFRKFADKNMPDPIERNVADPERKLGRDDRLIGPAILALKHGIFPEGLLAGIVACLFYKDPVKQASIADVASGPKLDQALKSYCGLSEHEPLFLLIKNEMEKRSSYEG